MRGGRTAGRIPGGWLVLLLSLPALAPALGEGYWWGAHDARHAVYFLFEFNEAFRDGVLWPRWSPDFAFGYGYPFFNVYGPLTAFVGQAIHLAGTDLVTAVKIAFMLSVPLSALAMYGFVRRLAGESAAVVAAVAYSYLPYHLADLYLRAAMAESWAFVFIPLVLWGFYEVIVQATPRAIGLTALAYGGFFLTHPGLAMQVTLLVAFWGLFWLALRPGGRVRALVAAAAAGALGLATGAIFILPWLVESRYVNSDQWFEGYFSFTLHFVELWQLFSPYWGPGVSLAGPEDSFPFQLGVIILLLAAAAWILPSASPTVVGSRRFFTGMALFYVFMMLEPSRPLWSSPLGELLLKPMQFPWRFLGLAGFALSVLAGLAARGQSARSTLLLSLLLVAGSYPYLQAEIIEPPEGPVSHAALMRFQQSAGELTGQSACVTQENIPTWSPLAEAWVSGIEVNSRFDYGAIGSAGKPQSSATMEITEVLLEAPATARWFITDYPGWHAYRLPLDSDEIIEELPIRPAPRTCHLTVDAPAGHYRLMVRFEDTPVRRAGAGLSGAGLGVVLLLLVADRRRARRG